MAGERPVTFDELTARRLIGLLRDRRNDVAPLRHEVPACVPTARRHRWAKATTNYLHPTFPTSGNVVLVEFGEYQFTAPTGVNQTVSPTWVPYTSNPYDESGFALAIVPTGGAMPTEGEVVRVELDDGQWYLRPSAAATSRAVAVLMLAIDQVYGGGIYISDATPGGMYCYDSYGDTSEIGITLNSSRSAYTDWAFSISEAGWYVWALAWIPQGANYTGTNTKTYTTSGPSSGTSHTHTVDVERRYTMTGQLWLERQAGGSGAWDFGVPADEAVQGVQLRKMGHVWESHTPEYTRQVESVWSERGITAGDRFRLTARAYKDPWSITDGVTFRAVNTMVAQLTIIRIGDNPT